MRITTKGTGIYLGEDLWKVWYKGVNFGEFSDLKEASDLLGKLLVLDKTRHDKTIHSATLQPQPGAQKPRVSPRNYKKDTERE